MIPQPKKNTRLDTFAPILEPERSFLQRVLGAIRIPALVCLIALTALGLVLPRVGFTLDSVETALFPGFLLALGFLPRHPRYRLPLRFVGVSVILWLLGLGVVRGYLPFPLMRAHLYLTQVPGDGPDAQARRAFHRRYNEIASVFSLPRMKLVHRPFSSTADAQRWVASQEGVVGVIFGNTSDAEVVLSPLLFQPEGSAVPALKKPRPGGLPPGTLTLPAQTDLPALRVVTVPAVIPIRVEEDDRVLHFLAWLVDGLRKHQGRALGETENSLQTLQRSRAFQAASLRQASAFAAGNQANAFRGIARFFLGTLSLFDAVHAEFVEKGELDCAVTNLNRTLKTLKSKKRFVEFRAATLNNLGIATLHDADNPRRLEEGMFWLTRAARTRYSKRRLAPSAEVARANLKALRDAGIRVTPREPG